MSRFSSLFTKKRNSEFNSYVSAYNSNSSFSTVNNQRGRLDFKHLLKNPKLSKQLWAIIIILVIAALGFTFWFKRAAENIKPSAQASEGQEEIILPYAQKPIGQKYEFPLRNEKGEKVSSFTYIVQNAELTNEIVVKGQKATSVKGRTFFILNLKINNDGKQKIQVNSRDYIRLIVNNNTSELLAPDIHNDPVEVQPISTKFTRLGFAINDTDKNLKVQVGEIDGEKQYIDLNFE